MSLLQHVLWGYELSYPDDWVHRTIQGMEGFARVPEAFEADYQGPNSGHILVKAEWNCARKPIEPLWNRHIGLVAGYLGARKVGSAPWNMAGAAGYEAEILLPKKEGQRLWAGVLARELSVLYFAVTHPIQDRPWFEPAATRTISSLNFPARAAGVRMTDEGLPLPPDYVETEPRSVIADIHDPALWRAYEGQSEAGALQAFYLREAPVHGWKIEEFVPFPSPADLGFARLRLRQEERTATLGILPYGSETVSAESPARLAVKYGG